MQSIFGMNVIEDRNMVDHHAELKKKCRSKKRRIIKKWRRNEKNWKRWTTPKTEVFIIHGRTMIGHPDTLMIIREQTMPSPPPPAVFDNPLFGGFYGSYPLCDIRDMA